MRKVKIVTDSTSDLSEEILTRHNIDVVPLYVSFAEQNYKDGREIVPQRLFEMVDELGVLPKTAAPSPYDYYEVFEKYIREDCDIVAITISGEMSSSYQNAFLAASNFPQGRILVVDSRNLSTGIGSLVLAAAEFAAKGLGVQEIVEEVTRYVPKVNVSFVIDNMEYLYKGGRCNVLQSLFATALKIRPVIGVENGKMFVEDKIRGDKKRAIDKIVNNAIKKDNIAFNRIFVTHSLGSEEEAIYCQNMLREAKPEAEIIITNAGCVISSHCGKKTIGVIYIDA